ncbi:MAG: B12-binding domain-containing radical SAM protein [Acidobacteriota bacterium]
MQTNKTGFKTLLIGFYNFKALGVKYLAQHLQAAGYPADIVFFKKFQSNDMRMPSEKEFDYILDFIERNDYNLIGFGVMSSLYLGAVIELHQRIKARFPDKTVVWGGVIASLLPEKCLQYADMIMRGESEHTFVELVDALANGRSWQEIDNVGYLDQQKEMIMNPLRNLVHDLDSLGYPITGGDNVWFINNDVMEHCDPQISDYSFELTASRGCPFVCSYCASINIRRLYKGQEYVRFRSVDSVMQELVEAKERMKGLRIVRFWDEIFSDDPGWIEQFCREYKEKIDLPFEIWGHPLKVSESLIKPLVAVGLSKIVVGIQSGSTRIRRNIFHRPEKNDQIIECSKVLAHCKVPEVIYDFILDDPFETEEDYRQTFELCLELEPPFELQLHGLSFLPGTDVVDIAVKEGVKPREEIEREQNAPLEDQYRAMYWWAWGRGSKNSDMSMFWIPLIFLTQVPWLKNWARKAANSDFYRKHLEILQTVQKLMNFYLRGTRGIRRLMVVLGLKNHY